MSETIGQRIRRLREERKMSASALAQAIGIRENSLFKIESGDTKQPSFTSGIRIARALKVEPWFLAFGDGPAMQSGEIVSDSEFERLAALVAETQRDLEAGRSEILNLRQAFASLETKLASLELLLAGLEQQEQDPSAND